MHAVETNHPATRVDAWAVNSVHCQAHYRIVAEAEPDLLCRVLNYFALQFLTPRQVMVNREEDLLNIDINPCVDSEFNGNTGCSQRNGVFSFFGPMPSGPGRH